MLNKNKQKLEFDSITSKNLILGSDIGEAELLPIG